MAFDLRPGETLLKTSYARYLQPISRDSLLAWPADGTLRLTNQRLSWRRTLLSFPFWMVRPFDFELEELRECRFVGGTISTPLGALGLVVEASGRKYGLLVARIRAWPPAFWLSKAAALEWKNAIEAARDAARERRTGR